MINLAATHFSFKGRNALGQVGVSRCGSYAAQFCMMFVGFPPKVRPLVEILTCGHLLQD